MEKDIIATVKSSQLEGVARRELLGQTLGDTELSNLKEAIARGYFTTQERHLHKGGSRRRDDRPRNTNSSSQVPAPEGG